MSHPATSLSTSPGSSFAPPSAILRAKNVHSDVPTKKKLRNSLERSASSGVLSQAAAEAEKKYHKRLQDKPSHGSEPLLAECLVVPEKPESFEDYFQNSYGDTKDIQDKVFAKNLKSVEKTLVALINEVSGHQTTFNTSLFNNIGQVVTDLQLETKNCQEMKNEPSKLDESFQKVRSCRDVCQRISLVCDDLLNFQQTGKNDPRHEDLEKVLRKLSSEETTYISKLMCLQRFFRGPLNETSVITQREDTVMFSELETILELHKNFFKGIEYTLNHFPSVPVGELLQFFVPMFAPTYLTYTENFEEAQELYEKLMKDNKEFRTTVKNLEQTNTQGTLLEMLQTPLRKMEQTFMYAEQFSQLTAPKSNDFSRLEFVIEQFEDLMDNCRKKANIADQLLKLQNIGKEIEDFEENLVLPDRELVYEGPIRFKPDSGEKGGDYVYLLTDILIYVSKKSSKKSNFVGKIGMHTVTLSDSDEPCSFHLTKQTSPSAKKFEFTLTADTPQQKELWFLHFSNVQRDVIRYRKVFGVNLKTLVKREKQNVPHFVKKSINFIREYGLETEGIFRLSGRATQIEKLRDQLDQGKKVFFSPGMDVHSVANLFKQWLREMPEPILTWKLYDEFIASYSIDDKTEKLNVLHRLINQKLPKVNRFCFQHMIKVLTEVIANESVTKLNAKTLSVVFAPNVLVNGDPDANPFTQNFDAVNGVFGDILLNYTFLFQEVEYESGAKVRTSIPGLSGRACAKKKRLRRSLSSASASKVRITTTGSSPLSGVSEPIGTMQSLCKQVALTKDSRGNASSPSLVHRKVFSEAAERGKRSSGMEGVLLQQEKQRWVERFFIVKGTALYKYKSSTDRDKKTRTRIQFSSILRVRADPSLGKPFAFELERKKENFVLAASSNDELLEWVDALTRHTQSK